MKILVKGYSYELANFENKGKKGQHIQFIQKDKRGDTDELVTLFDGTTNEEVIAVLIDRLEFQGELFPCIHNTHAVTHLKESLWWLNERTRDRKERNVEGKHKL